MVIDDGLEIVLWLGSLFWLFYLIIELVVTIYFKYKKSKLDKEDK